MIKFFIYSGFIIFYVGLFFFTAFLYKWIRKHFKKISNKEQYIDIDIG